MNLVEQAIHSWEAQRQTVIGQVEDVAEDGLDFRAGEGAKSFREIAAHIAGTQVGMVAEIVSAGSFYRLFDPQLQAQLAAALPPAQTKAELLEMLRITMDQTAARLRDAGESLTNQTMQTFGGPAESCLSGLWFGVAHEMYHSGQLAVYARALGRVPTMTQRIDAALAGAAQTETDAEAPLPRA